MADITLTRLSKAYGPLTVLDAVSLAVPDGCFCALLGPSGSGKTSLLRAIAGFVEPDAGTVAIGGRDVTAMPPYQRDVGIVFQSYALFPHLSVFDNVAFGLRMRRLGAEEIAGRVGRMLALVGMEALAQRKPAQLSGGQQQRVALARALVIRPKVLLLDEPLSALDRKIREEMRDEIKRLHRETGITTIMVTHDQEEAIDLADELVLMHDGAIHQRGAPDEIYHHPASRFVADFMGGRPLPPGVLEQRAGMPLLRIEGLEIALAGSPPAVSGAAVQAVVQPEYVRVRAMPKGEPGTGLVGRVRAVSVFGAVARADVDVAGVVLPALMFSGDVRAIAVDDLVAVAIDPAGIHCFA
ncbi:ABC transporter ATP-binding protein [Labrys wisconsinensis]|uniref:ABC-type Fe3+/spermidine/putrescine transport system ATPase subunit n=1 Tax=Labrys wisconsinensis TaxID=425677 RepID=A0ABU0J9N7_9HYPH|nr:ABC transporter ATP-binding protein [Labrys wisconsinensis]MDQ0470310.1 ABC-type Fe3+/spermidine/putrescine transport system ATPase subunit [Labrys wisconsinensis]